MVTVTLVRLLASIALAAATPFDSASLFERGTCSTPYGSGTCLATTSCTTGGFDVPDHCPGPANIQCCVAKTCVTSSGSGMCMNTGNKCSGSFVAGACPGPSDIQCCTKEKCSTSSGSGVCQVTSTSCSGKYVAGACPGPSDVQCCVAGSAPPPPKPSTSTAPPPPSGGDLSSLDLSAGQTTAFWSCAKNAGIKKVIIRGYEQACGSGGQVDPNLAASHTAAKAAGITDFDAYLFPCTGTTNGVGCKSISEQISAFLAAVEQAGISPTHYWLDIEPTSTTGPDPAPCNSWQLGDSGNEALAKQWVAALKATNKPWGIYANAGQWTGMFASLSTDIGSDLPLWAVQDDFKPGVGTVTALMGGWTKAYAKQYHLATTSSPLCGGSVDLDSFTA